MSIGFVGAGRIAQAIVRGVINAGFVKAENLIVSAHVNDVAHLQQMSELGCRTSVVNRDVSNNSDVIVVAVKPSVVGDVLRDVAPTISARHLIVSVALGITTTEMERLLPSKSRVIRVMPNTPCLVRQGATVFTRGTSATSDDATLVRDLFSCIGTCDEVAENCMDAVTGLSGSGPAYIYMIIEALADGGVKMGIPRELASKLAAQTVLGAGSMVMNEGRHPGSLKDDVTSPAGSTIHALHVLEKSGLRAILISAVEEATLRAKAMAREAKS